MVAFSAGFSHSLGRFYAYPSVRFPSPPCNDRDPVLEHGVVDVRTPIRFRSSAMQGGSSIQQPKHNGSQHKKYASACLASPSTCSAIADAGQVCCGCRSAHNMAVYWHHLPRNIVPSKCRARTWSLPSLGRPARPLPMTLTLAVNLQLPVDRHGPTPPLRPSTTSASTILRSPGD